MFADRVGGVGDRDRHDLSMVLRVEQENLLLMLIGMIVVAVGYFCRVLVFCDCDCDCDCCGGGAFVFCEVRGDMMSSP